MTNFSFNELVKKSGYPRTTVRDWHSLFSKYIPSSTDSSGNTVFNNESVILIHYIKELRDKKLRKDEIDAFLERYPEKNTKESNIHNMIFTTSQTPTTKQFIIPYLLVLKDRNKYHVSEINEALANHFYLPSELKKELLFGGDTKFKVRARYARRELQVAGLLEQLESNSYQITSLGLLVIEEFPHEASMSQINNFLKKLENVEGEAKELPNPLTDNQFEEIEEEDTPIEIMDEQFIRINRLLSLEVLEKVRKVSPKQFESIVLDLLLSMGYGGSLRNGETTDYNHDEGVDAIIKEDKLGLDIIYVQAKRWVNPVGRPDIQAFTGSLEGKNARKGVFITTSKFTKEAKDFVSRIQKKIILIDGELLGKYMLEHNVGVVQDRKYIVKKIDSDYFNFEE